MEIKEILQVILPYINMAEIAETYYHRSRGWLNHKINERVVNGVSYTLNSDEVEVMSMALKDIADKLQSVAKTLDSHIELSIKEYGRYYTEGNPFTHPAFKDWYSLIPENAPIVEPFAGGCNIPRLLKETGFERDWRCYDISPDRKVKDFKVTKRDTITNFPRSKVVITNPPFLAKNSAKRNGLSYPKSRYDNLYKHCLDLILRKSDYAAVILPDSFISTPEMKERAMAIISLNERMFSDTDYPVCLALFTPEVSDDFPLYIGDRLIGTYKGLQGALSSNTRNEWVFNSPTGSVGVICVDSSAPSIRFVHGDEIAQNSIKISSRAHTRISGLPENISLNDFLSQCNEVLRRYRNDTHDIFLTSFKGMRKDGKYRKRIPFSTIRLIMDCVLGSMQNRQP